MAFDIPNSLIREVQIGLRKGSGIPSYDPDDSSLPNLPSVDKAIAEFNPSHSSLRCEQCRGELLRGLQSMVCVYCGTQRRREIPPNPISFKSTLGYQWLLESLDLDGSDVLDLETVPSHLTKGQTTSKDQLVLDDLLNLEVKWKADSQRTESSITNKISLQSTSSLNTAGVNMENLFFREKKGTFPSETREQFITSKPSEVSNMGKPVEMSTDLKDNDKMDTWAEVADDKTGEAAKRGEDGETLDSNVEMLMSDMNDLSFMLESNLSIPKVEGSDTVL